MHILEVASYPDPPPPSFPSFSNEKRGVLNSNEVFLYRLMHFRIVQRQCCKTEKGEGLGINSR